MSFTNDYRSNKKAELVISSAQGNLTVSFPAFLTSFTNSFASTWNEEHVYGRQDPIGTFQGTKRSIDLGFDIVANDQFDARENLKKINMMTRLLYPSYEGFEEKKEDKKADDKKKEAAKKIAVTKNALAISKAPLVTIRFGNLIQEDGGALLGWISNWSANPVLEMGMFTPSRGLFFPKVFNATISFTPQHKQDLAFNSGSTGNPTSFPYRGK